MKEQTFLAVGGPLHGNRVTEQYAGEEYHRFNSADRVTGKVWDPKQRRWVKDHKPKCVLVHQTLWDPSHVQCGCWLHGVFQRVNGCPGHPHDL